MQLQGRVEDGGEDLRQDGDTPSGPGAFLVLCCWKSLNTPSLQIFLVSRGCGEGRGLVSGEACPLLGLLKGVKMIFSNLVQHLLRSSAS